MPKINTSNYSKLKMKLEQLQEEISKVSLPVNADLSNDFKLIMRLFWEEQQKYL